MGVTGIGEAQKTAFYSLAYSPDGTLLAAGTANGGIRLWQTAQGEPWAAIQDPAGTVYSVAFGGLPGADSTILASAGGDEYVRLWDVATQQVLATLDGPTNLIWSVAFSADGAWLAAGDFDGNVSVWPSECDLWAGVQRRWAAAGHQQH